MYRAIIVSSLMLLGVSFSAQAYVTNTAGPSPVNGKCGSSEKGRFSATPASGLCARGNAVSMKQTATSYVWTCNGIIGGTNSLCSAVRFIKVNGKCGSSEKASFTSSPTANLCAQGTADGVTSTATSYLWHCLGSEGGTNTLCSAVRATAPVTTPTVPVTPPTPTPVAVNGSCGSANGQQLEEAPSDHLCSTGTATSVTGTGPWAWSCTGQNNGSTASCSATAPVPLATVSFLSTWAQDQIKGGWGFVQATAPDRIHYDPAVTTPHQLPSTHVITKAGDDPINSSGERSEVLFTMKNRTGGTPTPLHENTDNSTVYMATSYFYPTSWGGSIANGAWSVQLQLHGDDRLGTGLGYRAGVSPAFAFGAGAKTTGGPQIFHIDGTAGMFSTDQADLNKNIWAYDFLGDAATVPLGKWVDFIFKIKFTSSNNGAVTVWRRDEGQTQFTRVLDVSGFATLQQAIGSTISDHYWKQGYYRNEQARTDEFWMGPTARAGSFADAELAAFNTRHGENPATKPTAVVNGQCGTANGAANYQQYLQRTMCSSGVPSRLGNYSQVSYLFWTCAGSNGGTAARCQASK